MLSFPKRKSECNSLSMVNSSFLTSTLSTLRGCQFGFSWQDPFLSSLFSVVCPTVTHCWRVYSKYNAQKVPCYLCLLRFLIRTLKWNGHKALYCKGTTCSGTVLLPCFSKKALSTNMHTVFSQGQLGKPVFIFYVIDQLLSLPCLHFAV